MAVFQKYTGLWRTVLMGAAALFCIACSNGSKEKEVPARACEDRGISMDSLTNIADMAKDGYICDAATIRVNKMDLSARVIFDDSNYKIATEYRSVLLFDKREGEKFAINYFPYIRGRNNPPLALYILNEGLMPLYAVTRHNGKLAAHKYIYKNGQLHISVAVTGTRNMDVAKLSYKEVLELVHDMRNVFTYEDTGLTAPKYFYDTPYWTEGLN